MPGIQTSSLLRFLVLVFCHLLLCSECRACCDNNLPGTHAWNGMAHCCFHLVASHAPWLLLVGYENNRFSLTPAPLFLSCLLVCFIVFGGSWTANKRPVRNLSAGVAVAVMCWQAGHNHPIKPTPHLPWLPRPNTPALPRYEHLFLRVQHCFPPDLVYPLSRCNCAALVCCF